ncbi:MAG: hypothetical protein AB8F95_00395 [Bacteroidia bacterium]
MKSLENLRPQSLATSKLHHVKGGAKVSTAYSYEDANGFRFEVKVKDRKNGNKTIIKSIPLT